jgi:chromosomal replication initiation ATPase DnaA
MLEEAGIGYNPEFVKRVLASRDEKAKEEARQILREATLEAQKLLTRARIEARRITDEAAAEHDRIITMAKLDAYVRAAAEKKSSTALKELRAIDEIAMEMCQSLGVDLHEVKGRCRGREISAARHAIIAAVYVQRPDMSLNQIGRYFNRDHTSVLHAVQQTGVWRGVEVKRAA